MKKKLLISISLILVFLIFIILLIGRGNEGFKIRIKNSLDQEITNLVIEYPSGPKIVSIKARSEITTRIIPKGFGEGSINLIYEGREVKQNEMIFGYIEPGYSGKALININSINEKGKLELIIKSDLDLY